MEKKFNPKKLDKLNNPKRLKMIPPEYIWDKLGLTDCKTIVDIGAGTGLFSKAFAKLMDNGVVYALDISDVMIDWMIQNINDEKIVPMLMYESKTTLDDSSADLVIMITLHHELDDPQSLLKEANRVLTDGGKICIVDWKKEEMDMGPSLDIRYSAEKILDQLIAVEFKNCEIDNTLGMFNMVYGEK